MGASGGAEGEFLIVARVRRPHGVRGELMVAVDTDRPQHVFRSGRRLRLGDPQGAALERELRIERFRPVTGGAILKLEEIASREQADELRGRVLLMPAQDAAPAAGGEVHFRDLVGMTVSTAGEALGTVEDILELPSAETLVVRRGDGKEILVPFVRAMVREIDLERREVRVELPEGFLEV